MASTYVNDLRLNEMATGDGSGTWGTTTNTNLELIAEAFSYGTEVITTNADTHTTTIADGATDPGRSLYLKYTGTLDSACTITIGPNTVSKVWIIENGTSGSQNIIISQGSGADITIPAGDTKVVYSDGAGAGAAFVDAFASLSVVDLKVQDDLTVTDDASIGGDATITGTLGVTGNITGTLATAAQPNITSVGTLTGFTSTGIDDNADATAITIDSSENVGIGTTSPGTSNTAGISLIPGTTSYVSATGSNGSAQLLLGNNNGGSNSATDTSCGLIAFKARFNGTFGGGNDVASIVGTYTGDGTTRSGAIRFLTINAGAEAERVRIDSSGNLLVGKTAAGLENVGIELAANNTLRATKTGSAALEINRLSNDGDIAIFWKDTVPVGSIGTAGGDIYIDSVSGGVGLLANAGTGNYGWTSSFIYPTTDNARDLGTASFRFDDIYATNGTIQTSDRNEKQDIEALTDAETRVAVAAKGLLRKFRWQSAVEEKGDEARIHFGIIAQDLQDAFTAEGLDAGDYAMFISTTWWETQTEVAAVEAVEEVTDEEGNVTTEAVEAKDAYTRTDTYHTAEEAPEGATEKTRLGIRYSELLAFIIAAI
jgi:hypothetical protein